MDVFDKILKEHSWRFPKGYPVVGDPDDKKLLWEIFEEIIGEELLNEEEKEIKKYGKKDIIDLLDVIDDEDKLHKIFKFVKSNSFSKSIDDYLKSKNLNNKDIQEFLHLLSDMDKLGEFTEIANNPPNLDLNQDNYYTQIPGFEIDELKSLFIKMKDSIKGNIALGPGENFLSLFFGNVKKNPKKGDLLISDKDIEVKSRTGNTGAILAPKKYKRGDFTSSVKPFISKFIKNLKLEKEEEDALENFNVPSKGGTWPKKIDIIYKEYLSLGGDKNIFKNELDKTLSKMYPTLDLEASKYLGEEDFDSKNFTIDIAKQLSQQYYEEEKFDGLMISDPNGDFKYYSKDSFIEDIGKKIIVIYPTDLIPRLKI